MTEKNEQRKGGAFLKTAKIVIGIAIMASAFIFTSWGGYKSKGLFSLVFMAGISVFCSAFAGKDKKDDEESEDNENHVDENGNFDLETPRSYTAKQISKMQSFLGSGSPFKRNRIEQFDYADGRLHIQMANGDEIDAPLEELEMIVRKNPKGEGPTGYDVRHGDKKINIVHNTNAFDESAVQDMENILQCCSVVREPNSLKILTGVNKAIGVVRDMSSSDAGDAILSVAEDKILSKVNAPASGNAAVPPAGGRKPQKPKSRSLLGKLLRIFLWIIGIIAALFTALVIWALLDDDIEVEDFDETRTAYFFGEAGGNTMIIPLEMDKDMTIRSKTVRAIISPKGDDIMFNVEDGSPYGYVFRADGNPGVWGAQVLTITPELDEDEKIAITGSFEDTDCTESDAHFILMQPDLNEDYYFGTIGDDEIFFTITSDDITQGFTGSMIHPDMGVVDIEGTFTGRDEYGDAKCAIAAPNMNIEIRWWSNGGDTGFVGEAYTKYGCSPVSVNHIDNYEW